MCDRLVVILPAWDGMFCSPEGEGPQGRKLRQIDVLTLEGPFQRDRHV